MRRDPVRYRSLIGALLAAGTLRHVEPLARGLDEPPQLLTDREALAVSGKAVLIPRSRVPTLSRVGFAHLSDSSQTRVPSRYGDALPR
jgi:hypothetical protein